MLGWFGLMSNCGVGRGGGVVLRKFWSSTTHELTNGELKGGE